MITQLRERLDEYRKRGVQWGSELLLRPEDALNFIDDLEAMGIVNLGLDGWHYIDRDKGWIVQELETELTVPDDVLDAPDAVRQSAALNREFVRSHLPPTTEFVSFVFDDGDATSE